MFVCFVQIPFGFSNSGVEQAIGCYDTPVQVCVSFLSFFSSSLGIDLSNWSEAKVGTWCHLLCLRLSVPVTSFFNLLVCRNLLSLMISCLRWLGLKGDIYQLKDSTGRRRV